jgi:hypothetical protein
VPLVLAGGDVEHDHSTIAVAVADVHLIRRDVLPDLRRLPEVVDVVAAVVDAMLAELEDEFSSVVEFQDLRVLRTVAGQPHVALMIDGDAMIAVRPVVAFAWTTPRLDQIPAWS